MIKGTTRRGDLEDNFPFLSKKELVYGVTAIYNFITFLIQRIVQRLRTTNNMVVRVILWSLGNYIITILKQQGILISFCENELTDQVIVLAMVSGSLSGFITTVYMTAWYKVSMTIVGHYSIVLLFGRYVVQHFGHKRALWRKEKEIQVLTEKYNKLLEPQENFLRM